MTPAEIQCLFTAVVNHRGECVCYACAAKSGDPARDMNTAPVLTIDPAMPILGVCPECAAKYQVPAATAIALLAEGLVALRQAWFAEQIARDPYAKALIESKVMRAVEAKEEP